MKMPRMRIAMTAVITLVACLLIGRALINNNERITIEVPMSIEVPVSMDELIAAYKENDTEALEKYAQILGVTTEELRRAVEDFTEWILREKKLGTWQDALKNGKLVRVGEADAEGDVPKYYDVNGDGIPDFEIWFKGDSPKYWRFLDSAGRPYG